MAVPIKLDIVDLDDGYHAYYVNGLLRAEDQEDMTRHISDYITGFQVEYIRSHYFNNEAFDEYGLKEPLPNAFEDIPREWMD